jgi:hypothetical protein
LTEADYFTLGLRNNAFLNVGLFVSSFPENFEGFIEHLTFEKLRHWDTEIRRLAAAAMCQMVCLNPEFLAQQILKGLIKQCFDDNI